MNEMIFKSEEFGKVRTYGVNGETWFVGQDVAHALGYRNTRTALAAHVEKEDKTTVLIQDIHTIPGPARCFDASFPIQGMVSRRN